MEVKVNIKRPQITKEEIAANKNFGEVLHQYEALYTPFYKKSGFYAMLSAAAVLVIAVIISVIPSETKKKFSLVQPPFKKINIPSSQYSMNADIGTTITSKSGSVIKIPAKAFVDKSGKPVDGKVDVSYRELNEPVDFFIAGIPMNYDSAGTRYAFESAGIIEIHASQRGKELDLNPGKVMNVMLASHHGGKQFNLYQLDSQTRQWVYRGKEQTPCSDNGNEENNGAMQAQSSQSPGTDTCSAELNNSQLASIDSKLENARYELQKSESTMKNLEALKPFEPKEESKGHHRFSVNVSNLKDYPEFNIYKDVMFQVNKESEGFDNKVYNSAWDNAKLSKRGESYVLVLTKDNSTVSYSVHPVFEGEGYIAAQKTYKQKLAEYEASLIERKATEGEKQQELEATIEVIKESRHQAEAAQITNSSNLTFHSFTVRSCGIWTLDNPVMLPQGTTVNAQFTDDQGKEIQFAAGKIYLVEKGRNVLFSFSGNNTISYDPEKQNMIWGITSDDKIAVFRYEDFKAIGKQTGDYTFKMQVSDLDLADEGQVDYFLNI